MLAPPPSLIRPGRPGRVWVVTQIVNYGTGELAVLLLDALKQRCCYEHRLVNKDWYQHWCKQYATDFGHFRILRTIDKDVYPHKDTTYSTTERFGIVRDLRPTSMLTPKVAYWLRQADSSGTARQFVACACRPCHIVAVRYRAAELNDRDCYAWYLRVAHESWNGSAHEPSCRLVRLNTKICYELMDYMTGTARYGGSRLLTRYVPCADFIRVDPRFNRWLTDDNAEA